MPGGAQERSESQRYEYSTLACQRSIEYGHLLYGGSKQAARQFFYYSALAQADVVPLLREPLVPQMEMLEVVPPIPFDLVDAAWNCPGGSN